MMDASVQREQKVEAAGHLLLSNDGIYREQQQRPMTAMTEEDAGTPLSWFKYTLFKHRCSYTHSRSNTGGEDKNADK